MTDKKKLFMVELEPEIPELKGVEENSPEYWEIVKKLLADEFTNCGTLIRAWLQILFSIGCL